MCRVTQATAHMLLTEVLHAAAKARAAAAPPEGAGGGEGGGGIHSRIVEVAEAVVRAWAEEVRGEVEEELIRDAIVLPTAKPVNAGKTKLEKKKEKNEKLKN